MPITLSLIFMLFALITLHSKPKLAFKWLLSAFVILTFSSLAPISDRFMIPMEQQYESFTRSIKPVDYIVVLGCGHTTNDALPPTSQLQDCSLKRMIEGIRILSIHPEAMLITSGYSANDPIPNAEKVKQAAISLGVAPNKILVEPYPKDTGEEAQLIAPRVKGKHVVLVTDAYHLPRAMHYFALAGVNATPAPASFWVKNQLEEESWSYYLPSSKKLTQTSIAWYETMGRLWQWIAY